MSASKFCPRCQKVHPFQNLVQATRQPETWRTELRYALPEIIGGTVILLVLWAALAYLPVWL